ncbi:RNA polymerase sigma-70 factor (ECF subfamily) [Rhodoblastus acidophilus]|nr:RNA polymerase sigma-70 factor (ECF subfamily) [Rhodoblastus acidophilus]
MTGLGGGGALTFGLRRPILGRAQFLQGVMGKQTTESDDPQLLARIARGDRLAMQVLFARHRLRVFRFILRFLRDEGRAEDALAETFVDVWRQAGAFEGRSSVSTWILSIARFKALSIARMRKDAPLDDDFAAGLADEADDPEVRMAKGDKAAVLRACIQKLSPEHREIVDLVYYQEQSVEEAAAIIGIPPATVKTRLFYARQKLSEICKRAGVDRGWP